MAKFLLFLLIVIAGLMMWRLAARKAQRQDKKPPSPAAAQQMVRCAECGVHLPEPEALAADDKHFCDEAHRAAYLSRHSRDT